MKIIKLSYTTPDWELKNLELNSVNLIVAKNATGKSRTLLTLDLLINTLTQKKDLDRPASWDIQFSNNSNNILNYKFKIILKDTLYIVTEEYLTVDNDVVISRNETDTQLKNMLFGSNDSVFPPVNKLVLHTNRDVKKYPFLEDIANWARNSFGSKFGNIMPYSNLNPRYSTLLSTVEDTPVLFKSLSEESKKNVILLFNATGYNISEILVQGKEDIFLSVKENEVNKFVPHFQLAQGMYRSLSLVILFEYLFTTNKPDMFIIDDLCEGLDYERAKKLGELIFNRCLASDVQLVATSNDIFLMEVVDIKYWNILIRKGKTVEALNYSNNQKIFDDFRFTGLSNFDFFSSDFLTAESK